MRIDEQRFIEAFRLACVQAGAVARRLQGRLPLESKSGQRSPEGAALTAVDLAAQDILLHALHAAFPDVAVDAEEDTATVRLFPPPAPERDLVVLDPIDGTLNYARGSDDYAVMAALLSGGEYRASLIHFPAHDVTYWALRGGGCWEAGPGLPPHERRGVAAADQLLVSPHAGARWRRHLTSLGLQVSVSRCSAVDASAPATGRAVAALSSGRPDRRRAIGYLLTLEAGGVVRLGRHTWRGEDPAVLPADAAPAVAAASGELARRVLEATSEAGHGSD